jgi:RNA polymerase sigma factor (sigma-70 family)
VTSLNGPPISLADQLIGSSPRQDRGAPEESASRLFDEHAAPLLRYLNARVGRSAAEDLLSETFVVVIKDLDKFDPTRGSERSWLFAIATNLLRHHYRGLARSISASGRDRREHRTAPDHADGVADQIDAERRAAQLADAIDALTDDDREVLLLVAWGGLTPTEAASSLGIPPGTARSRLHRVRRQLRRAAEHIDSTHDHEKD